MSIFTKLPGPNLRELAKEYESKLMPIKCCAFDVDGILTTGHIRYDGEEMGFNRSFHTSDGYGMKVLMEAGLKVGVISGGASEGVHRRFKENLKLDFAFLGNEDKREGYLELLNSWGFQDHEILYMGDEFFDLPLLKRAGFSATVLHASHEIHEAVDYIASREGGYGACREVIDLVRYAQNITPNIRDFT